MEKNGQSRKYDNYESSDIDWTRQMYRHCPICTKEIKSNQFKEHADMHTGVRTSYIYTLVQYQCPRCPMIFNQISNTRDHLVSFHLEEEYKVDRIPIHRVVASTPMDSMQHVTVGNTNRSDMNETNRKLGMLPGLVKSWKYLPVWLRSLEPYDHLPCRDRSSFSLLIYCSNDSFAQMIHIAQMIHLTNECWETIFRQCWPGNE